MVLMSLLHSMKVRRRFFPINIYEKKSNLTAYWFCLKKSVRCCYEVYISFHLTANETFDFWHVTPKVDVNIRCEWKIFYIRFLLCITKLTRYYSHGSTDVRKLLPCEVFDQASNKGAFAHFWRSHHHYNNRRRFQRGPVYQGNVMFFCFNILSPTK